MHTGKRLAMLNAKNCRFDIGSGGIPDIVATDVAAALGMVAAGIGREVLCRVWWPDGAKLSKDQLNDMVDALMRDEWAKREASMLDGLLAIATRGSRGQGAYATAHANRWPRLVITERGLTTLAEGYGKVRTAVLNELASAGLCPYCAGRGMTANTMGVYKTCAECTGAGHLRLSDRGRAELAGFSWKTYREGWATVYDWTFQRCTDDLHQAERQFQHALT
ncbi:hypothetical protein [Luteibacter rhizovicinus]|nr:hypothetical protein [Luteibacter rhizovicinus]KLD68462.1 hypothetical protein Y883_01900 [Luteibacter rhizovicinus DSM 16549]KLD76760.1 hypothetical protein Y886_19565 [Xanthomonas hyacinthi DSM 19077]